VTRGPVEARFEAALVVVVVMALQLALALTARAADWTLWEVPWWVLVIGVVPEAALLVALVLDRSRRSLERRGYARRLTLALFGVVSLVNALLLVVLIASLVSGHERDGGQLLFKALVVWSTNTITFGLWFWALDRSEPAREHERAAAPPDFLFPQQSDPELAAPGWRPRLFDYLYVSFTNSIAFSPTDTMPLTHSAKGLMLAEASVSSVTVLLVVARAVNIFT
jgi:uncharacterized membrane protein